MKLKYLCKDYKSSEDFTSGFKLAFKIINEKLTDEINNLEQYPMMTERIFALKLYMKKMDDILKEAENE